MRNKIIRELPERVALFSYAGKVGGVGEWCAAEFTKLFD